jgi:hypothetical protein
MNQDGEGPIERQRVTSTVTSNTLDVNYITRLSNGQLLLSHGGLDGVLGSKDGVEFLKLRSIISIVAQDDI